MSQEATEQLVEVYPPCDRPKPGITAVQSFGTVNPEAPRFISLDIQNVNFRDKSGLS